MERGSDLTPHQPGRAGGDSALLESADDEHLIKALRAGDEEAFATLLRRYHAPMIRVAALYVPNQALAEEVVQETWIGVLQRLGQFEQRSSLKTWLFRILTNQAKTRAKREERSVPFSALQHPSLDSTDSAVDPARFFPPGHQDAGHWIAPLRGWEEGPEDRLLARETRVRIEEAIAVLPATQRAIITLRDVEGWTAADVCHVLGVSDPNQRVLLHRARSKVRRALEHYFGET